MALSCLSWLTSLSFGSIRFSVFGSVLLCYVLYPTTARIAKRRRVYCSVRVLSTSYADSSLISPKYKDSTLKKKEKKKKWVGAREYLKTLRVGALTRMGLAARE